jgi:hypothetical protein
MKARSELTARRLPTLTSGQTTPLILYHATPETAWKLYSSPHTVQMVSVEKGVSLEVLDWGGRGRPQVLLTGWETRLTSSMSSLQSLHPAITSMASLAVAAAVPARRNPMKRTIPPASWGRCAGRHRCAASQQTLNSGALHCRRGTKLHRITSSRKGRRTHLHGSRLSLRSLRSDQRRVGVGCH